MLPAKAKDLDLVRKDAWSTHFWAVTLIVAFVFGWLLTEQPWDCRFLVAFLLVDGASLFLYWGDQRVTTLIVGCSAVLAAMYTLGIDPVYKTMIWIAFCVLLWATNMELVKGSPAIPEAWRSAAGALAIAIVLTAMLNRFVIQFQLWSALSIGLLLWTLFFGLLNHFLKEGE